jgi:hypothetical protein
MYSSYSGINPGNWYSGYRLGIEICTPRIKNPGFKHFLDQMAQFLLKLLNFLHNHFILKLFLFYLNNTVWNQNPGIPGLGRSLYENAGIEKQPEVTPLV